MAESYFGKYLCKLTTWLCWPLFQERSVVNLDRFHCIFDTFLYKSLHLLHSCIKELILLHFW